MKKILILIFVSISIISFSVGVKPLSIDIDAQPGDIKEFILTLSPSKNEEKIKLSFYQPIQTRDGAINYDLGNKQKFPVQNWLKLETEKTTVYAGKNNEIKCQINVPFNAGGSETIIIMIENDDDGNKAGGIKFMVRYAVRVNIRVSRVGLRKELNFNEIDIVANENKKPVIKTTLQNSSKWDFDTSIEATLRDSNRKLVERLYLKTSNQRTNQLTSQKIYPNSTLDFSSPITKRIDPGKYTLRTFIRYGNKQKIINQEIVVKKGDFIFPSLSEAEYFSTSNDKFDFNLRAGLRKTQMIELNNELNQEYFVGITLKNIKSGNKNSLNSWIQLRGKNSHLIRKRGKQKFLFTLTIPRKTINGSYHGIMNLVAFNKNKKILFQKEIPITAIVGENFDYKINFNSIYGKIIENNQTISCNFYNKSNIFITPYAEIVITDKTGKFIERVELNLPENIKMTLPDQNGMLIGTTNKLGKGKYKAEIKIINNEEELLLIKKDLIIES